MLEKYYPTENDFKKSSPMNVDDKEFEENFEKFLNDLIKEDNNR